MRRLGVIIGLCIVALGVNAQPRGSRGSRGSSRTNACEDDCAASCMARYGRPRTVQPGTVTEYSICYQHCVVNAQCRPAPARTGALYPKYQILTILYAPPGCTSAASGCGGTSEVSYESGISNGTRVSAKRSFASETEVGVDAGLSVPGFASLSVSATAGFSVTASDGSSETITKARSTVIKIAGNTDGIKSGQDQFVLLLNPAIGVRVVPPPPARNRSDTTVPKTFWSIGHSGPAPIIYTVYASELKDPSTMRPTVASQLSKLGFTNADFATILAQDPFATGATSIDPKRYVRTTWTFPYEPPLQSIDCNGGVCSCAAFSGTIRNDLENELTADIQTEYSVGYSVSEGPSLPDGGTLASLNVKDSTKFTWTNSASRSATTSSSQTASVSVVCPSTQYAGPTLMAIYWDSLYGSFVFAPLDFAGSHIYQGKLPGGPVKRGETVELSYGGKTYRTVSGREGAYRFVLPASGRAAMLPQTAELSIRGVRQVVNVTPTRDLSSLTRITNDAGVAWSSVGALWTRCAAEGATCAFSGAHQVRYGANGKYATKTITGSTPCTNAIFGDPAPGVEKFCEYQSELTFQSQPNNNP